MMLVHRGLAQMRETIPNAVEHLGVTASIPGFIDIWKAFPRSAGNSSIRDAVIERLAGGNSSSS